MPKTMSARPFPREALLHVVKTLPAAPQILARLSQLRLDPNTDLADVAALIRCDAALTARIIRIANSPTYSAGKTFASIEQALARVGFGEIYKIAGFAAVTQMANQNLRLYGITGAQMRENSLLTALTMEAIAEAAGADSHEAHSAGLLRSTGKIALDGIMRDIPRSEVLDGLITGKLSEWEIELAGLCSSEAGVFILNEWRFPVEIVATIGYHYTPATASSARDLAHMLNLAAGTADRLGFGLPGEQGYWLLGPEMLAEARITQEQLDEATRGAFEKFGLLRASLA
jgi:HD-like signal output (HDOD) protein